MLSLFNLIKYTTAQNISFNENITKNGHTPKSIKTMN